MPCVALGHLKHYYPAKFRQRRPKKSAAPQITPTVNHAETNLIFLNDGDSIQIRPFRARPTIKLSRAAVRKSARELKQLVKFQTKAQRESLKAQAKSQREFAKAQAPQIQPKPVAYFRRPSRADLINAESRLGSTIFGPVPADRRREFFHDRDNIWIWHESWTDAEARRNRQFTVRYEVRPSGVYKKLAAGKYFKLEGDELENFRKAAHTYLRLIKQQLYHVA